MTDNIYNKIYKAKTQNRYRRLYKKTSIVATLGTSPPVVTEFLQFVEEALDRRVTDLTLLATREEMVLESVELVRQAVKDRYPHVHLHVVELPFKDINSEEKSYEFAKKAYQVLLEERIKHKANIIYLCIAGGRKDMCIILSLLGQIFGVDGIYHVVMPDVKAFNIALERIRKEMTDLLHAEDKEGYYQEKKEVFELVMFPPPSEYAVIRLPLLPYPPSILQEVLETLRAKKTPLERATLPASLLSMLETSGFVRITGRTVYIEDLGYKLLDIFDIKEGS